MNWFITLSPSNSTQSSSEIFWTKTNQNRKGVPWTNPPPKKKSTKRLLHHSCNQTPQITWPPSTLYIFFRKRLLYFPDDKIYRMLSLNVNTTYKLWETTGGRKLLHSAVQASNRCPCVPKRGGEKKNPTHSTSMFFGLRFVWFCIFIFKYQHFFLL